MTITAIESIPIASAANQIADVARARLSLRTVRDLGTIEAGQISRCFGGGDQVINGQAVAGVWQTYLAHFRADGIATHPYLHWPGAGVPGGWYPLADHVAAMARYGRPLWFTEWGTGDQDLEPRLDSARFVRLGRGTLANLDAVVKVNVMPGGTHLAVLTNGQKLQISRIQSRRLRSRLLACS